VFNRELSYYCSQSQNNVTVTWLPQGLHDTPNILRQQLKQAIDNIQQQKDQQLFKHVPEAIVLGYGLCSNGPVGLRAGDIPIILPRTDDCIALFLGSQKRYLQAFEQYSGTYWLNNGWVETAFIPSTEMLESRWKMYSQAYGADNADYLMEVDMEWVKNYQYCGYISSPVYKSNCYTSIAKTIAADNGWSFLELEGNTRLIERLVNGEWNEDEFLVCPPYHEIQATFDENKVCAVPYDKENHD